MEEAIRALLLASSGVTALVGTRVNFGAHPQGQDYPAIVLNTISDIEDHHMNGAGGLSQGRVQVDVYAGTYGAAKVASRAVKTALHFHRDSNFFLILHLSTRDTREGGTNEADRPHRVGMDFSTSWRSD